MTNATRETTNFVEVELSIDLTYHRPTTDEEGKLTFEEFHPDEAFNCFKCKVPKEVLADKVTLTRYVREQMEDCDIIGLNRVNIWDGNNTEGDFRFS